ncbi:MAG TPA: class I SAM-dependent methyltransferase [Candidatus Angelobacter sp.]
MVTPGDDDSPRKLNRFKIPDNLSGKTFLDIGAWDGFFSFEAERRGAARVLALDSYVWEGRVPGKSKEGFLTARSILNSRVEDMHMDAFDISPDKIGMWDVVLLAGVLYHVKHPWLLLEKAASVTRQLLIVETFIDLRFKRRPAVALYPLSPIEKNHADNWCGPNTAALKQMLIDCKFSSVEVVYRSSILHSAASAVRRFAQFSYSPFAAIQQGRCVVHARH